jgi:hypothetical protein
MHDDHSFVCVRGVLVMVSSLPVVSKYRPCVCTLSYRRLLPVKHHQCTLLFYLHEWTHVTCNWCCACDNFSKRLNFIQHWRADHFWQLSLKHCLVCMSGVYCVVSRAGLTWYTFLEVRVLRDKVWSEVFCQRLLLVRIMSVVSRLRSFPSYFEYICNCAELCWVWIFSWSKTNCYSVFSFKSESLVCLHLWWYFSVGLFDCVDF